MKLHSMKTKNHFDFAYPFVYPYVLAIAKVSLSKSLFPKYLLLSL